MISPKKITEQELCGMLIEKHQEFLEGYKREFDIRHQSIVLREKKDQLEHWLKDSEDDAKKHKAYVRRLEATNQNMLKLEQELEKLQSTKGLDEEERYKMLKQQIDMHNEALNYWTEKFNNLSTEKKEKEITKKKPKKTKKRSSTKVKASTPQNERKGTKEKGK